MNRSKKTDGLFHPQTLDVDESILNKALRIVGDDGASEMSKDAAGSAKKVGSMLNTTNQIFPRETMPVIKVTPHPGLCVKSKNIEGDKVFINICKIMEIPPPPPLTEDKLKEIIATEDYSTDFRVPMSLGGPRQEKDKSGSACLACDVAINTVWFDDVMFDSIAFTTFVVNVAMEGLCEKYGDQVNLDRQHWTILKNKKYLGKLQKHHIQQRANTPGEYSKITEMDGPLMNAKEAKQIPQPEYFIVKMPVDAKDPDCLMATIKLPGQMSKSGLMLDVGEDRLVFSSRMNHLDVFLPFRINQDGTSAQFDSDEKTLVITMPLVR